MDELFSEKQAVSTSKLPTTTIRNHFAFFTTLMSNAVSGTTGKNAVNHADTNKEETIDYNDMPADICEQYALENHPKKVILMEDMKAYHNNLTLDKHGAKQK